MDERQAAWHTANRWLDGRMRSLVDMVPGDHDCSACVLARQYMRALDKIAQLTEIIERLAPAEHSLAKAQLADKWPTAVQSHR
jgi:hypothetical protein